MFGKHTSVADPDAFRSEEGHRRPFSRNREMYGCYGLAFYGDGRMMFPDDTSAAEAADKKAKAVLRFLCLLVEGSHPAHPGGPAPGADIRPEPCTENPLSRKLLGLGCLGYRRQGGRRRQHAAIKGFSLFWLIRCSHMPPTCAMTTPAAAATGPAAGPLRDYRYNGFTPVSAPETFINIAQAQGIAVRTGRLDLAAVFGWMIQYQGDLEINTFRRPFSHEEVAVPRCFPGVGHHFP